MKNILSGFSILNHLVDQILPPRCAVSGEIVATQGQLSAKAWQSLNFIADPFCHGCGLPLETHFDGGENMLCGGCLAGERSFSRARSAVVYDDASRNVILAFKHGDQTHLAGAFMPWLKTAGADMLGAADMLVPVPLHWRRLVKRRYNQSALIARLLARETGSLYAPDVLIRTRHTPVQGHLNAKDRLRNVRSAFLVPEKYAARVRGKNIVVIDDVYTTGATVEECARALQAVGAARVDVLTLARVARPDHLS